MKVFRKQPGDVLDYTIDFDDWLPEGDLISAVDNVMVPPGITQQSFEIQDRRVVLWFSGGTSGQNYKIELQVNTIGGRTKEVEFQIAVVEV